MRHIWKRTLHFVASFAILGAGPSLLSLAGCATSQTPPPSSEAPSPNTGAAPSAPSSAPTAPEARNSIAAQPPPAETFPAPDEEFATLEIPGTISLRHGPLRLAFSVTRKTAVYAEYTLTADILRARFIDRDVNPFGPDPQLATRFSAAVVRTGLYTKSGYDRGHLAPAEDLSADEDGFFASFYTSNIAPQSPDLNRRAWFRLEEDVRGWACGERDVRVLTGPLFGIRPPLIKSTVPVPEAFFKVVIDQTPPRKVAAFVYPQNSSPRTSPIQQQVALGDLEARLGFPLLKVSTRERGKILPLAQWQSATCPATRSPVSARSLLRLRKKSRLGQDEVSASAE